MAAKPAGLTEIDGPAIGDRAPDIDFERGGTLFDRLRHPYFTLLAMPSERDLCSVTDHLERRFGAVLAVETLPTSEALARRYGVNDGRLFLVRPDGYLAFKAKAEEASLLEAQLDAMLAVPTA